MLSNDRQTNKWFVEIDSKDNSLSSRIELLRRLLVVLLEIVEEDWSLSSKSRTQRKNILLVQYQSTFIHSSEWCSAKSTSVLFFVALLSPSIWLQRPLRSVVTLVLQVNLLELPCCCNLNQSRIHLIHEKFWPMIENYLSSETRFWLQFHVCRTDNWSWFPIRVQFTCFPESILLVVMTFVTSWKSVFTSTSRKERFFCVFSHEILSNLNNMYESCIHTNFTHFVFLWKHFDSFFISLQQKILVWRDVILHGREVETSLPSSLSLLAE